MAPHGQLQVVHLRGEWIKALMPNSLKIKSWCASTNERKSSPSWSMCSSDLACKNIRFSSLFAAGDISWGGCLRLNGRNSILMTQSNVYIINPAVMGFQIQICPILCVFWLILVKCCLHLLTSSSKTQMLLLEKTIFHKYWLLEIHRVYIWPLPPLVSCLSFVNNS